MINAVFAGCFRWVNCQTVTRQQFPPHYVPHFVERKNFVLDFVRRIVLLKMSNDWALCRAIANANERVREEGDFIVDKIRENNYRRTTDILQAMNSEHLTEVQAATDRSDLHDSVPVYDRLLQSIRNGLNWSGTELRIWRNWAQWWALAAETQRCYICLPPRHAKITDGATTAWLFGG